jgi:hypothetical protein
MSYLWEIGGVDKGAMESWWLAECEVIEGHRGRLAGAAFRFAAMSRSVYPRLGCASTEIVG